METGFYDLKKLDDIKVNFIVGPGRSGTTLLVYVLNQSDKSVATPEIKHLLFFYKKYKDVTFVSAQLLDDFRKYLSLFKENKQFLLSSKETKTWLDELKIGQQINYARLSKLFYLCLIEGKEDPAVINCIIDKNPYYTFYIDRILKIFPEAKFIVMVRDYRAYILSNRQSQKPFVKILSVFYYGAVWNLYIKKISRALKKHGSKIRIIKYEALAENKEKIVEEITTHFNIEYSPSIFDFYKNVAEKLTKRKVSIDQYERALKKLKDLSSPINMSRVNSWQTQLTKIEIEKADFMCSDLGSEIGYFKMSEISFFKKVLYTISSFPGRTRVRIFMLMDTPALNYLINIIQIKKKKSILYK